MDIVSINLKFSVDSKNEISVTEPLWNKWNLTSEISYTICFGERSIKAKLKPINGKEYQVNLPQKISEELNIPFPKHVQATIDQTLIRLGPLIGLLTNEIIVVDQNITIKNNNRNDVSLFTKMLSAKEDQANYTFVFTPSDVDWSTKTIIGTFMTTDPNNVKQWAQHPVPIPDVIYNRISGRNKESSREVQTLYKNIEIHKGTKMFNPYYFNKETIHNLLKDKHEITQYLPETHFSPTIDVIENLIKRYRTIYLKPKNDSGGRGIYRITKLKSKEIYVCNTEREITKYKSLNELLTKTNISKKYDKYLAQQGVSLIKYNDSKVDFRINLNKNIENKWKITAIAGKVSGKRSVTTHVRLGGGVHSGNELLLYIFKEEAPKIIKDMEEAAIKLASAIEFSIDRTIGELGLDIGVDKNGRVWMLEANSIPGRCIFEHQSLKDSSNYSINLLFQYAYYLSNFTKKSVNLLSKD